MRNKVLEIRLTTDEKEKIRYDAGRCGMCLSTYVRQKTLGGRPRTKDMTLLRNELTKVGGLLKHLHNSGLGHSAQTAEILSAISTVVHNIDKDDRQNPRET